MTNQVSAYVREGLILFGLKIGLATWFITFVVMPLLASGPPPYWGYIGSREFLIGTLASIVLWPLTGVAWGWWRWKRS